VRILPVTVVGSVFTQEHSHEFPRRDAPFPAQGVRQPFVTEWPLTATGKVKKYVLRKTIGA
jgi:hypothetical protein